MSHPTNITNGAAAGWRRERSGKPNDDREAHARALWQNAQTPELRAHLRKIYPDLFAHTPDPKPRPAPAPAPVNIPYPEGFHRWPLEQRNEWWVHAYRLYAEAQKGRRS